MTTTSISTTKPRPAAAPLALLLLAACAADPDDEPAAGTPDGATDAAVARITVLEGPTPVAGDQVVFHGPDGEVVATATTDAQGQASGPVVAGSFITVARAPDGAQVELYTVAGVQPDDELTLQRGAALPPPATATIQWNGAAAGAAYYQVSDGCGQDVTMSAVGSLEFPLAARCLSSEGTYNLLALARPLAEGDWSPPIAAAFLRDVAVGDGISIAALPAWSTAFETVALAVDGRGDSEVYAGATFRADGGELTLDDPAPLGPDEVGASRIPAGFAPDRVTATIFHGGPIGFNVTEKAAAGAARELAFDLAADALPVVLEGSVDSSEAARPRLTWQAAGSMAAADVVTFHLDWGPEGGPSSWILMAPPATSAPFAFPALPAALAARVASPAARIYLTFEDLSYVDGYDQVRATSLLGTTEPPLPHRFRMAGADLQQPGSPDRRAPAPTAARPSRRADDRPGRLRR